MRGQFFTALLLLAPFAGVAAAQDSTQAQRQDSVTPQSNDAQSTQLSDDAVLMRMHHTNMLEIRAGKLAQRNGTAKVKAFGARLVRDHTAADGKVVALAKKLGISLTPGRWKDDSMQRSGSSYREGVNQQNDTIQGNDSTARHETQERGERGEHGELMERLGTLHGAAFDAEFANAMVQGHDKAIAMLERAQGQVQHDELRTLIANTLPTIRQHRQIAESLGGTAATVSSSQQ